MYAGASANGRAVNLSDGGAAYFVPYLSAVRLFADRSGKAGSPGSESSSVLYEFSETDPPPLRPPLAERCERLAGVPPETLEAGARGGAEGGADSAARGVSAHASDGGDGGGEGHRSNSGCNGAASGPPADGAAGSAGTSHSLLDTRLCDLHRESWYAVAWYPIYRIPDTPLRACFLTYHQFMLLPGEGEGRWELPTVGAIAANTAGEIGWFGARGPQRDEELSRVRELAAAAEAVARQGPPGWRHADYEFLCSRGNAAHQAPPKRGGGGGDRPRKGGGQGGGGRERRHDRDAQQHAERRKFPGLGNRQTTM